MEGYIHFTLPYFFINPITSSTGRAFSVFM
jgi:hypothetical protein